MRSGQEDWLKYTRLNRWILAVPSAPLFFHDDQANVEVGILRGQPSPTLRL